MGSRGAATLALGGVVLAAAAVWGTLGQQLDVPTVFGDELIHWDASRSLADGDGLRVRDGGYGFAPGYAVLLAPVHAVAPDDLTAYEWARLLSAFAFGLAAVPAYLLARRLLPRGWSLACAALAVGLPSALYAGFVMTEGVAYLVCVLALLALARCLERPTVAAQLFSLASLALAAAFRLQLAALAIAFVVALPLRALLVRGTRRLVTREDVRRLWPLLVVLGAAAAAVAVRALIGNPLAGYADLWRSYDLVEVLRWTWRALAGLGLYLALVALVVAPAALLVMWRRARGGDARAAAFASLFLSVNVVLLLVVGAFSSTEFGVGFLHDRYLFYVVPLWLVATAVWAEDGRREVVGIVVGACVALALLATLPTYLLNDDGGRRFDAVASGLPSEAAGLLDRAEPTRLALVAAGALAIAIVLAVALLPLPRWLVLVPVALVFALNAAFAWDYRIDAARNTTFAPFDASTTGWVDAAVPDGERAAVLAGPVPLETRDALRLTEFFNGSIGPVLDLGAAYAPTLASDPARVGGGGVVLTERGPVELRWIVAPRALRLAGEVEAEGAGGRLRLWRATAPVRVLEGDVAR